MHLSRILGSRVLSPSGEAVGKVDDLIVRLRGGDYPLVTGLVAKVGGRRVFVPIGAVSELTEPEVVQQKHRALAEERAARPRESSSV